jgi:hypothetical protein
MQQLNCVARAYHSLATNSIEEAMQDDQDLDAARYLIHVLCLKALALHGEAGGWSIAYAVLFDNCTCTSFFISFIRIP